ncbi:hypothetical protein IEQ34_022627 [Dendrobium chrysotoxum]|uniref:Guanine nucleotide-binding protein subunit beta-like protein n=1 Tax=Dendrobium chrysotoxum TaxID=161865 RepID=A0AAV7FY92_DENCH|nr:hypothetical protein IEQ34_022627 [Dendrobium chrysotoxum]
MAEPFFLKGMLSAHSAAVTAIATPIDNCDMMVSSSRDKSIIIWDLTKSRLPNHQDLPSLVGLPRRRLTGHSHFIQDVVLSFDGQFALSGSWDGELRLWDLEKGCTSRRFVGHTNSVLSVAFSFDNRQIVSGSRDKTIKLWNTVGSCKYTIPNDLDGGGHTNWVSSVRFIPDAQPTIVSGSWDRTVKVWNLTNCKLQRTMTDHGGYVNAVTVSPDGSVCASGGRDDEALLWDINGWKKMYSLNTETVVHAVCFCPNRYWLCAATQHGVLIWDLDNRAIVQDIKLETPTANRKGTSKVMIYAKLLRLLIILAIYTLFSCC